MATAWTLADYFNRRGHWRERAVIAEVALRAAHRLGDRDAQAGTHRGLASAYHRLARFDDAHTHIREALNLSAELCDRVGQAYSHLISARILEPQGGPRR